MLISLAFAAPLLADSFSAALALQASQDQIVQSHGKLSVAGVYRQEMFNIGDLQYYGELELGGQKIKGIFDTGSFELVVFSTRCPVESCGKARAYDPTTSSTYTKGQHGIEMAYGSGNCQTVDGHDKVKVGDFEAGKQAFWEATHCEMPLLQEASFNCIVGIGPPGQPEFTAKTELEQVNAAIDEAKEKGKEIPTDWTDAQKDLEDKLQDARTKPSMLENFGVKIFSACLGRKSGASGWLIWNDKIPTSKSTMHVPIVGSIMWGVKMDNFGIQEKPLLGFGRKPSPIQVDCKSGCGAVVDTGTSLIGVPTDVYYKVLAILNLRLLTCSNLKHFPELTINLGGHSITFPPEAYIGKMFGEAPNDVKRFFHINEHAGMNATGPIKDLSKIVGKGFPFPNIAPGDLGPCMLLLMDLGDQKTQYGPMYILGMPFFRELYTTFDVGEGRGNRHMYMTPADNECRPSGLASYQQDHDQHYSKESLDVVEPKWLDASKLRVPHWLKEAKAGATHHI